MPEFRAQIRWEEGQEEADRYWVLVERLSDGEELKRYFWGLFAYRRARRWAGSSERLRRAFRGHDAWKVKNSMNEMVEV